MTPTTRTKRPTIRDVAAKAGVSKSLVSLVFSAPQTVSNYRKDLVLKLKRFVLNRLPYSMF